MGAGDLYILISISDHPRFKREGQNLEIAVRLKISDVLLGTSIDIPTLDVNTPEKRIKIPPGLSTGTKMRLKGLGFPAFGNNQRGDLLAVIEIEVPNSLTSHQKELAHSMRQAGL